MVSLNCVCTDRQVRSGGLTIICLLSYALLGAVAGLMAGLLGLGGGIIIVPALSYLFASQNLPIQHTVHLAVGTSLATIIFTAISSVRAHHLRGAVDWQVLKAITPGIIIGTGVGSYWASRLSTDYMKCLFAIFLIYVALQMLLDLNSKPSVTIPGKVLTLSMGVIIGGVSSLVGIGGGSISVPYLIWCNHPVRKAIGTSAAIGFPIALSGAIGYVFMGMRVQDLPSYSLGFVYLPALVGVALASVLTAPYGARLAHRFPVGYLRKGFAVFLLIMAVKMISGLYM